MIDFGKKLNVKVNCDMLIMARCDFNKENLRERLNIQESETAIRTIISHDLNYQSRLHRFALKTKKKINPNLPVCGVGTYMVCLSANGDLYPCPGFKMPLGNVKYQSIEEVWKSSEAIKSLRSIKWSSYPKCLECLSKEFCVLCLAKNYNETGGDLLALPEYFCSIADLNKKIVMEWLKTKE